MVIRSPLGPPIVTATSLRGPALRSRSCFRCSISPMMELATRITRNSTNRRHHDIDAAHCDTWELTRASHPSKGGEEA